MNTGPFQRALSSPRDATPVLTFHCLETVDYPAAAMTKATSPRLAGLVLTASQCWSSFSREMTSPPTTCTFPPRMIQYRKAAGAQSTQIAPARYGDDHDARWNDRRAGLRCDELRSAFGLPSSQHNARRTALRGAGVVGDRWAYAQLIRNGNCHRTAWLRRI